jgi:hypothetical protein
MSRRVTYYNSSRVSFRPINLAGSQLYFAKNTATPSLWNDQSPNGFDLSQMIANRQPIISANSVDFDGSNDVLFRNVTNPFFTDMQGVIFFSFFYETGVTQELLSSADADTNNYLFRLVANGSTNKIQLILRENTVVNNVILNTNVIADGYNYGYIGSNGSNFFGKINGINQSINATDDNGNWFNFVSNRDNLAIGAVLRLFQGFFATKINKIYYNNTALNSSELSKLEMFFSNQNNY